MGRTTRTAGLIAAAGALTIISSLALQAAFSAPILPAATEPPATPATAPDLPSTTTVLAAGDIADCSGGAATTAAIISPIDGVVAALGDLAYDSGTADQFAACYLPTWGAFADRTRPTQGNHDVRTAGARPYFDTFGANAGPNPQGYYSYELADWHVIVLNSNCAQVGGCDTDSPQASWLRDNLAATDTSNILAYWHHPRFSTGKHGDDTNVDPLWRIVANAGADIVLNGHDHDYQRFTPMDADGKPNPHGLREFVVGTGGKGLRDFHRDDPRIEYRQNATLGVLRLDLEPCGYTWTYLTAPEAKALDHGEQANTC